jgi:hypothetical protein
MNVTPLRTLGLAGCLLAALFVQSSTAAAAGPQQVYQASVSLNRYTAGQPQPPVAKPSPAASVGAGVAAATGLLILGGASRFGRRRLRLPAS